jgi:hypothetical protein
MTDTIPSAALIAPHRVRAFNTAAASENKIHDDAVARRFGFSGGLVPGVELYAYVTHMALSRWGRAWLASGAAECRFLSPVYDGKTVDVTATGEGDKLAVTVESDAAACASGTFSMNTAAPAPRFDGALLLPPADRPAADERSLAPGRLLGIQPFMVSPDYATQYLLDIGETDPLCAREAFVHPGIVLRLCNQALVQNVVLGPWIHVGSAVRNFSAARVGEVLSLCAEIARNYERKRHRFVDLDIRISAGNRPVAEVSHVAIWRPRQVLEKS